MFLEVIYDFYLFLLFNLKITDAFFQITFLKLTLYRNFLHLDGLLPVGLPEVLIIPDGTYLLTLKLTRFITGEFA